MGGPVQPEGKPGTPPVPEAASKPGVIQLGSLEIVLLVVVIIIIFKMFILTGCPCGCGAMSSMWCQYANNLNNLREEIKEKENPSVSVKDKPTIYYHYTEWCGYCKKLYESGELQKAAKTHLVVVVDEKHKQAEKIMKETGSGGFPTIAIHCKQRGFGKYEGPRTAKAMIAACSCNSVKSSDTNPQIIKVSNKENPIESAKTVCRETGKGVLICLLADWCGHCKRLKESGELDKVAMTNPVMIVSDENEHTSSIMNEYKSRGFPTLLTMKKSGMIKSYDGQRMSQEIVKSL